MSTELDNQVDFIPDTEKVETPPEHPITCKNCIHKDVCYFLTQLDQNRQSFKLSGILELPFDINILATTCRKYETTKPLADTFLRDDTAKEE